jgi:hypothetical protein
MAIRIHAINQMARGCKVTLDPGGSKALRYVVRSIAREGWSAQSMGWVEGKDLTILFVEEVKKAELTEHLKADSEFDFSKYR